MNDMILYWVFITSIAIFGGLIGYILAGLRCQRLLNKQKEHFAISTPCEREINKSEPTK